jgi:hypothetical protein
MGIVLFTTHCPKCEVLYKKLTAKGIEFTENTDVQTMKSLGMMSAPALQINDGRLLKFTEAVKWVEAQ